MPEITDEMVMRAKEACKPAPSEKTSTMIKNISVDAIAGSAIGTVIGGAVGAVPGGIAGAVSGAVIGAIAGIGTGTAEIERPDTNCVAETLQHFSQGRLR